MSQFFSYAIFELIHKKLIIYAEGSDFNPILNIFMTDRDNLCFKSWDSSFVLSVGDLL